MAFVDPNTIHNPAAGTVAPAAWGDVVRDDLVNLDSRKPTAATVATSQTETNTSYDDLATVGPAVTVTTGTRALVMFSAVCSNSAAFATLMSFAVSGATTSAATDARGTVQGADGKSVTVGRSYLMTGLTAGSNTFTLKYRVGGGTGTYENRHIIVIPQD